MATYIELDAFSVSADAATLRTKIRRAITVTAQGYASGTPTPEQLAWAKQALANPSHYEQSVLNFVLAANKALTTTQIAAATDTAVQTNVDSAVSAILGA